MIQSQQNLAIAYFDLGRYTEAESLLVSILERSREKYNDTHEITTRVAMNLAMVWVYPNGYHDAEVSMQRVVATGAGRFDLV